MSKSVIILNGPSSSGKSTLVSILKEMIKCKKNVEYGSITIDDYLRMSRDEAIYEDDVFEVSSNICENVTKMLDTHQGVIIDHVITSERIFKQLIESLKMYDVCLVHVTCPLSELERRENERGNRCPGSAKASFQYLYPKDGYDLTVDTSILSSEDCSLRVVDILQ